MQAPHFLVLSFAFAFVLGLVLLLSVPSLPSAIARGFSRHSQSHVRSMAQIRGGRIQRTGEYMVIPVPVANRLASRNIIRRHKYPNPSDVISVRTLPGVTPDGRSVPQRTLRVRFSGNREQIAAGYGKREVVYPGATSAGVASPSSRNSSDEAVPLFGFGLLACNVNPPPFRTLPSFEGPGSLSNGVVALHFYVGTKVTNVCSGWLVHPKRVVTAAHCIYDESTKTYYFDDGETLVASTGLNGGDDTELSRASVASVAVSAKYTGNADWLDSLYEGSDIAVLTLEKKLNGRKYRWGAPWEGSVRMVLGYPGVTQSGFDQIGDIVGAPRAPLSFGCFSFSENIICDDLSVEGGHSGSPLFAAYNKNIVVGTLSGSMSFACPALFTLSVQSVQGGVTVKDLLKTTKCTVSNSSGWWNVTWCQ